MKNKSEKAEKERLNIYISSDLSKRLEFCADRYGVSRNQLAVILIGQGLAGIEEAFKISNNIVNGINLNENDIK